MSRRFARTSPSPSRPRSAWRWSPSPRPAAGGADRRARADFAVPGALTLGACMGWELVRGTLPGSLVEGILLGPLRHPGAFFLAPDLGPGAVWPP